MATPDINGYIWGYPLVRMERVIRDYTDVSQPQPATSYRAPLNQIGWAKALADPDVKEMPTSNNDTLYMSRSREFDRALYPNDARHPRPLLRGRCF